MAAVRPLHLSVPDTALDDLRDRLARTRWPAAETGDGEGPPLAAVQDLARHWATAYDWRRVEADLDAHGQALTEIDGLDIHFLHVRSARPDARPLVLTHGWPSSVLEPLRVMDDLATGTPAFHVVAPSLPGFGLSGKAPGWTVRRTADAWVTLMGRLGYDRFLAAGGDWGGRVTAALGTHHPDRVLGLHTFTPYVAPGPETDLTEEEAGWVAATKDFWRVGGGYSLQQSTRPQTLAYGLVDSPVAQLTWILDKFLTWTDPRSPVNRDDVLDTVTLYWLTATGGSSARFYRENFPPERDEPVPVPAAVTVFPADIERFPRRWVETRFTDLRSWRSADRGGHFPMLEVPDSYADEVRRGLAAL
jgi:epoxide hydrolase